MAGEGDALLLIILAIIFPPAAAAFVAGCGADLCINVLLTMLGYLPGCLHAFWLIIRRSEANELYGYKNWRYAGMGAYVPNQQVPGAQPPPPYGQGRAPVPVPAPQPAPPPTQPPVSDDPPSPQAPVGQKASADVPPPPPGERKYVSDVGGDQPRQQAPAEQKQMDPPAQPSAAPISGA